jgi:hypothetical protein
MTDQEREMDIALAEAEQENRLLRARNERLERQAAYQPEQVVRQLVAALEGSGTRMRSDQWYVEIEALAAGKHYLNTLKENE